CAGGQRRIAPLPCVLSHSQGKCSGPNAGRTRPAACGRCMRFRATLLLLCGSFLLALSHSGAADAQPSEYAIKSAFLFNFLKFVEWPASALPQKDSPIIIGLIGGNVIRKDLEEVVQNHKIAEHPIVIEEFDASGDGSNCHMLFIDGAHGKAAIDIL